MSAVKKIADTILSIINSENKKVTYTILIVVIGTFFFRQYPRYDYIDYGVYNSYARSIVEDGNLNISDELYSIRKERGEPVIQTPTHYDPDFHSHGSAIVFSPFLLLGKILYPVAETLSDDVSRYLELPWKISKKSYLEDLFIGLAYVLSALIGLAQLYKYCFRDETRNEKVLLMSVLLWATPFYMYSVHYSGNMNIVVLPLLTILYKNLYDNDFRLNDKQLSHFLLLLTIGFVVKVDVAFVAVLVPFILWNSRTQIKIRSHVLTLLGFILVGVLFLINRYLQYGSLHLGYGGVASSFIPMRFLFTPFSGLLFTCPIFIVLLMFYFTTQKKNWKLTVLLLVPLVKFIAISFAINTGIDFGWRDTIGNLYIWGLLLVHTYRHHRLKRLFILLCGSCTLWTMLLSIYYNHLPFGEDYSFYFKVIFEGLSFLPSYFLMSIQAFHFSWLRLVLFLITLLFLYLILKKKEVIRDSLPYILIVGYLVVTILNFINRDNNIIYDDANVTDDIKTWYSIENK